MSALHALRVPSRRLALTRYGARRRARRAAWLSEAFPDLADMPRARPRRPGRELDEGAGPPGPGARGQPRTAAHREADWAEADHADVRSRRTRTEPKPGKGDLKNEYITLAQAQKHYNLNQ